MRKHLAYAQLDGDGKGGPDDRCYYYTHQNDPAARVEGIMRDGNVVSWVTEVEQGTAGYLLRGRNQAEDPWQDASQLLPAGAGRRSATATGSWSDLALFEREDSGAEVFHGDACPCPVGVAADTSRPNPEDLRAEVMARLSEPPPAGWAPRRSSLWGEQLAILTPAAYVHDLSLFAAFLQGWYGVISTIVQIEQFGPAETSYPSMKAAVAALAGQGCHYFLLVGDASDWQYFDGPLTPEYWPASWEVCRQTYLSTYPHGGDLLRNLIPSVVEPDTSRWYNMAVYQPYYFLGDAFTFGNVDDDLRRLPDAAVGRWPFSDSLDVLTMINKTCVYLASTPGSENCTSLFIGDLAHTVGGGDAQYARDVADHVAGVLGSPSLVRRLYAHPYNAAQRLQEALNLWHQQSEMVVMVSSGASRYCAADFFQMPCFNVNMIVNGSWTPFVLGASCGMGEFPRTEQPTVGFGRPLMQRMLAAYGKGAVAWCGPSAGTYQSGNDAVATAIAQRVVADPSRPLGESVRLALRDVLETTDPLHHPDIIKTALSYSFFGFPLCPLERVDYPVAVDDYGEKGRSLFLRVASPGSGTFELTFGTEAKQRVVLGMFDVSGRTVRTLLDEVCGPGVRHVPWDGKDDRGRLVAAGVYFARLEAGNEARTQRVVCVR